MNNNHVQQIFAHYIDKFEYINNPTHQEYYKWQIAKRFRDAMDVALAAPAEEFPSKLYEVKKLTSNLIDSYTQPSFTAWLSSPNGSLKLSEICSRCFFQMMAAILKIDKRGYNRFSLKAMLSETNITRTAICTKKICTQ